MALNEQVHPIFGDILNAIAHIHARPANDFRAAVLMLTPEQARQSWTREQAWKRAQGADFFTRLVDLETGAIVATVTE